MAVTCSDIIKLIAAFLLPPLGVFMVSSRHREAAESLSEAFESAYSDGVCSASVWAGCTSLCAGAWDQALSNLKRKLKLRWHVLSGYIRRS